MDYASKFEEFVSGPSTTTNNKEDVTANNNNNSDDSQSDLESIEMTNSKSEEITTNGGKTLSGADLDKITFQDMFNNSKQKDQYLKIIYHKPAYELPIPINPKFSRMSVKERVGLLSDFHSNISKFRTNLARRSKYMAQEPKPILSSQKFNGSLRKNAPNSNLSINHENELEEDRNLYTTRSGRQMKRKIYSEEEPEQFDNGQLSPVSKRHRNNQEDNDFEIITEIEAETVVVATPTAKKVDNKSTKSVENKSNKNLTNSEIIKRSSLFTYSNRKTRYDTMFDKLKVEEEKKKKQEKGLEDFEKSLTSTSNADYEGVDQNGAGDIIDDLNSSLSCEDGVEEDVVDETPRRIVTPLRGRKGLQNRNKRKKNESSINEVSSTSTKSSNNKYSTRTRKTNPTSASAYDLSEEQVVASSTNKIECPICSKTFPQNEVERHAANCGESSSDIVSTRSNTITCTLCDQVFISSQSYELHIKNCLSL